MRILLTGATGYLGHHLESALRTAGLEFATAGRHASAGVAFDLDRPETAASITAWRPDVVLHAAAMASMGACEADPSAAQRRNAEATAALAGAGARVVLVSTDLVFDGRAAPYQASDRPHPTSAYGRSKAAAERCVLDAGGLVVRVPLLLGRSFDGRRGATDMLRLARAEGRKLALFSDEFRTPLHATDAARSLVELACAPQREGIVHLSGPERVSRFDLAERFADAHGWAERPWREARNTDPTRPPDVSLISDVEPARSLDEMLRDS